MIPKSGNRFSKDHAQTKSWTLIRFTLIGSEPNVERATLHDRACRHSETAMRPIPVGARGTFVLRVMPAHLANQFKDAILPEVFATPMMVTAMENAALNAIRGYLDPGESAVGTAVDIRHLAATPAGHDVTAEAEVTRVDGRRVAFNVTARDEIEEIGRGTHERVVVDLRRLAERLSRKSKSKA